MADKDWGKEVLRLLLKPVGEQNYTLPLPAQMSVRTELVGILEQYHSRHLTAAEYRRQQESDSGAPN